MPDVALGPAVAAERIEVLEPRQAQHFSRVAHDQDGADRLPLAALAADLGGEIDHRAEHIDRRGVPEHAKVLRGHALQVFAEVDHAQAIDRFRRIFQGRDAIV